MSINYLLNNVAQGNAVIKKRQRQVDLAAQQVVLQAEKAAIIWHWTTMKQASIPA